jgi:hypothetical protein
VFASVLLGVNQGLFDQIRAKLAPGEAIERVYRVDLADRAGTVHAEIEKTLHIRRREPLPAPPATH